MLGLTPGCAPLRQMRHLSAASFLDHWERAETSLDSQKVIRAGRKRATDVVGRVIIL